MFSKTYILSLWLLVGLLFFCGIIQAQPDKVYKSLSDIRNVEDVYILKLKRQRLTQIPKQIFSYSNLRFLDLGQNRIDSIPPDIVRLQSLEVLRLGRNNIDSLPIEIAQLSHLEELDLSRNPIEFLPEEMGYMLSLKRLILWSTFVFRLPDSFAELDGRLELLDLRSCQLSLNDQRTIRQLLPTPRIQWDQACNCKY